MMFPDWELEKGLKFLAEKDAKYRRYNTVLLLLVFRKLNNSEFAAALGTGYYTRLWRVPFSLMTSTHQ
jgi:hypothetical protein